MLRRLAPLLAGLLPVAVPAAWVLVRQDLPSTDVALLLVLSVAVAARLGGRGGFDRGGTERHRLRFF